MRMQFVEYLLRIGCGTEMVMYIFLTTFVSYSRDFEKDLDRLIECIFPNLNANMTNKDYITSRAILSICNDWVDILILRWSTCFRMRRCCIIVSTAVNDLHNYYPLKFLNTLTPTDYLHIYYIKIKIGCPDILHRDIGHINALRNGTRLVVRGFRRSLFNDEIVLRQHVEKRIFLL